MARSLLVSCFAVLLVTSCTISPDSPPKNSRMCDLDERRDCPCPNSSEISFQTCDEFGNFGPCEDCETVDSGVPISDASCPERFTGLRCDICRERWQGSECDQCAPGYFGVYCCPEGSQGENCEEAIPDAGMLPIPDAGLEGLCFEAEPRECQSAMECGENRLAPTNCSACKDYNRSICQMGQCETPPPLASSDPVNYLFAVGNLSASLLSFAGILLTAESSGGQIWTCEDFYSQSVDLDSMCHNILDTRGVEIGRPENEFTMTFSRFASEQRTLFVVYGFPEARSAGTPIGVSCTSYQVGSPGQGLTLVEGEPMRRLE